MERKVTKPVKVGQLYIGGGNPVVLQSMTNTDTRDYESTIGQIKALEEAGCQLIRCAVPDMQAAEAIKKIKGGAYFAGTYKKHKAGGYLLCRFKPHGRM